MEITAPIIPTLGISTGDADRPKDIASAAEQFEALMLHQLLQAATEGEDKGWFGTGEQDQAGLQAMSLAQEQFAAALASRGGLGLAQMITAQLSAQSAGQETR